MDGHAASSMLRYITPVVSCRINNWKRRRMERPRADYRFKTAALIARPNITWLNLARATPRCVCHKFIYSAGTHTLGLHHYPGRGPYYNDEASTLNFILKVSLEISVSFKIWFYASINCFLYSRLLCCVLNVFLSYHSKIFIIF